VSAVDWSALTAAEVFESLTSAPKVAGPWTSEPEAHFPGAHARRDEDGSLVAEYFRSVHDTERWSLSFGYRVEEFNCGKFDEADAARAFADATLTRLGWRLA
jgi:hypothetical protein